MKKFCKRKIPCVEKCVADWKIKNSDNGIYFYCESHEFLGYGKTRWIDINFIWTKKSGEFYDSEAFKNWKKEVCDCIDCNENGCSDCSVTWCDCDCTTCRFGNERDFDDKDEPDFCGCSECIEEERQNAIKYLAESKETIKKLKEKIKKLEKLRKNYKEIK